MRSLIFALALALPVILPSAAAADEYVFSVPVRIENARSVSRGTVNCLVSFHRDGAAAGLAQGSATFEVADGAYSGTLSITAPVPPASRLEDQTRWRCGLALLFRYDDGRAVWIPASLSRADQAVWYTHESGQTVASYRLEASAEFPR